MAASVITEYLGAGPIASRPVTPDVPTGVAAIYFAADEGIGYAWNGSSWVALAGAAAVSLVQDKGAVLGTISTGLTLDAAPQDGDLLLAFGITDGGASLVADTGWGILGSPSSTNPDTALAYKIAGSSEGTGQTPFTNAVEGAVVIYVLRNWKGMAFWQGAEDGSATTIYSTGSGTTINTNVLNPDRKPTGIYILGVGRSNTAAPTGVSGLFSTLDYSLQPTGSRLMTGHASFTRGGSASQSLTFAASVNAPRTAVIVH